MDQVALDRAGGPSTTTLRQLDAFVYRDGPPKDLARVTLKKLDHALQWEQGSARDVLAGGEPRPLPGSVGPEARDYSLIVGPGAEYGEIRLVVTAEVAALRQRLDGDPVAISEFDAHMLEKAIIKLREIDARTNPANGTGS